MADSKTFRELALSFTGVTEAPHFNKAAFKVKKIFATLQEDEGIGMIQLSAEEQSLYCKVDPAVIYPVPGGWGWKGATYIRLAKIKKPLLKEMMAIAYKRAGG